jgi:polyisoprenoid-binding protein YceI
MFFQRPIAGALAVLLTGVCVLTERAIADEYKVDPAHSFVSFRIKHMGVSYAYGRFNDFNGVFMVDQPSGNGLTFDFVMKADSVDTGNAKRDQHLKTPDFFNVKEFPAVEFKSKQVRRNGEKGLEVGGDLTMHGVTRPINVHLERVGSGKDPWGGYRTGYEGSFVLKRSDFGMNFGSDGMLGDDVTVTVAFEGTRK